MRLHHGYDPAPAEVLGSDERARLRRWNRIYQVGAAFEIDDPAQSELLMQHFDAIRWLELARMRGDR